MSINLNFQATQARIRPHQPQKCPRCNSMDTKFCYYNNYSLNQPRHYCKTCRRYWTQGGICRNIPIGGSTYRRNKKARASHPHSPLVPIAPSFARHDRLFTGGGSITFSDEFDSRVSSFGHTMSTFGPMPLLYFNNSVLNINNNVASGYKSFQTRPPPLHLGVDAWHPEDNLLMSVDPNNMYLRGFNAANRGESSDGSRSGGPPLLVPSDIDVINDKWHEDLPDYTPSPPLPPPLSA